MSAPRLHLAAWCLAAVLGTLAACGESPPGGQALSGRGGMAAALKSKGLVILALDNFTKRRLPAATPRHLLDLPAQGQAVPRRFDIDERTEFHAFFSPAAGAQTNPWVAFVWRYGAGAQKLYCEPAIKKLRPLAGFKRPVATSFIWSAPSLAAGFLSQVTRPVQSRAAWRKSRVYGPRSLTIREVTRGKNGRPALGRILARARFEIYHRGVVVY